MASSKRKIPKIRFDLSSIEEIQRAYQTRRIGLEMIKVARREVQAQIRALNEKRNIGKKISTIGLALILCPEPVFSNLLGIPLFILGGVLNRIYPSSTITDLMDELRLGLNDLKDVV